jgi:hypothetical protein
MTDTMTKTLCLAFDRCVATGGDTTTLVREWAEMLGVQRPAIWRRLRSGGSLPPYKSSGRTIPRRPRAKTLEEQFEPLPPTVNRDPCLRCGVRADVGCKHSATRSLSGVVFG